MDWSSCLYQNTPTLACIPIIFANILTFLFSASGIVALFIILYAGLKFILANGDSKQLDSARKTLFFGVIGLVLVLCAYLILNIIATVTGVNCILVFGPFTSSVTIHGHSYTNCFVH